VTAARDDLGAPSVDPQTVAAYRLEDQIGYLIRRAHQRASAIFEEVMGDFEVTPVQFAVLAKLHDLGPTSQNLLGRMVGIDPPPCSASPGDSRSAASSTPPPTPPTPASSSST
jgi:hypothetical protein